MIVRRSSRFSGFEFNLAVLYNIELIMVVVVVKCLYDKYNIIVNNVGTPVIDAKSLALLAVAVGVALIALELATLALHRPDSSLMVLSVMYSFFTLVLSYVAKYYVSVVAVSSVENPLLNVNSVKSNIPGALLLYYIVLSASFITVVNSAITILIVMTRERRSRKVHPAYAIN